MDDLLLATSLEASCQQATLDLLKSLANQGYKVSRLKAQLCLQQVKYLSLTSEGPGPSAKNEYSLYWLILALRH